MALFSSSSDSIATVQLSPFVEGQWHRIVTYSPIYDHWTDMVFMSGQRPQTTHVKYPSRKLNGKEPIDINTLKLEDEILLNEIHGIRRSSVHIPEIKSSSKLPSRVIVDSTKSSDIEPDHRVEPSFVDEYQASTLSGFNQPTLESLKHRGSYVTDSSVSHLQWNYKRPISSVQSMPRPVTSVGPVKSVSNKHLTTQPESSVNAQLRQSAITRDRVASAVYDRHLGSSLSYPSSKRTITGSAPLNQSHHPLRAPSAQTSSFLPQESDSSNILHEKLTGQSLSSLRRPRAKSSTSTRSAMHLLTKKNERYRRQHRGELKTLLVDPWKQPSWTDTTLEEAIPNSIDVMHKMCGPATAFERNLRQNYHRQLFRYRHGAVQS